MTCFYSDHNAHAWGKRRGSYFFYCGEQNIPEVLVFVYMHDTLYS